MLVCNQTQPPPQTKERPATTTTVSTRHTGDPAYFLSPDPGAPGNDLRSSGTGGQISLCLSVSHVFSPFPVPHITSCLGSCALTAAQITAPQTGRRRGSRGGLHLGHKLVALLKEGRQKETKRVHGNNTRTRSQSSAASFPTETQRRLVVPAWIRHIFPVPCGSLQECALSVTMERQTEILTVAGQSLPLNGWVYRPPHCKRIK